MRSYYDGVTVAEKVKIRRAVRRAPMEIIMLALSIPYLLGLVLYGMGAWGVLFILPLAWANRWLCRICREARLFALAGIPPPVPGSVPESLYLGQMTRDNWNAVPGVP